MTPALEIRVAQIRNQYDALGQAVADLVRDAYAAGRSDGLAGCDHADEADRLRNFVAPSRADLVAIADSLPTRRPTVV